MNSFGVEISLAIALFAVLLWLLRPGRRSADSAGVSAHREMTRTWPGHYRYFPQIRQALSAADEEYLRRRAPAEVANRVRRQRRAVARKFLSGLREDFASLEQMGRMVAALSPAVNRKHETERLALSMKFQFLYALVWLRLSTGSLPLQQLEELTGLVGRLALRMEQAMAQINALALQKDVYGLKA